MKVDSETLAKMSLLQNGIRESLFQVGALEMEKQRILTSIKQREDHLKQLIASIKETYQLDNSKEWAITPEGEIVSTTKDLEKHESQ